ncbi:DUF1801 domain-containing protein [Undibacterium flavidum]|uniref:DUF1801 domain-containing protein n=1 Tax=Undibacterium flavidum TaxID=2762297 RepID=A0ABR6YHM1_9BURK|nr:DUF1801 domain-containing protein [Undibacterium flavidum]MBC3876028.1 DUF1801 domain-containing protein [Undibacterium flavidum]
MGKIKHQTVNDTSAAVNTFMLSFQHPHKDMIESLRGLFLSLSINVAEGIKWNAPSFRTHEYFATINLREKQGLGIILHLGAKIKTLPEGGVQIDDPQHLLKWLATDRASVVLLDADDFVRKESALRAILLQWILYV